MTKYERAVLVSVGMLVASLIVLGIPQWRSLITVTPQALAFSEQQVTPNVDAEIVQLPRGQRVTVTTWVQPGDSIEVRAVKCNTTSHMIPVVGASAWQRLDVSAPNVPRAASGGTRLYEPDACVRTTYRNEVPDLEPGIWMLTGFEWGPIGTGEATTIVVGTWSTQPIRVLAAD